MAIRDRIHNGLGTSVGDIAYRVTLGLGDLSASVVPSVPGIEYSAPARLFHYKAPKRRFHHAAPPRLLHYTSESER